MYVSLVELKLFPYSILPWYTPTAGANIGTVDKLHKLISASCYIILSRLTA